MKGVTYTLAESITIMNKANSKAPHKAADAKLKQLNRLFLNNFINYHENLLQKRHSPESLFPTHHH